MDILTKISLVTYSDAKAQALNKHLNGIPVSVLHLEHLVLSKFNTGRAKDAADIEELQRVEAARKARR